MNRKDEAIAAIAAANPKWSERHVRYSYELMPTTVAWMHEKGSPERAWWEARHAHFWVRWAIEMNIIPDDTEVPALPNGDFTPVARSPSIRREPVVEQQGIGAPREGTMARKIWNMCSSLGTPTLDDVIAKATELGYNIGNTKTEFSRWRKFNKNLGTK